MSQLFAVAHYTDMARQARSIPRDVSQRAGFAHEAPAEVVQRREVIIRAEDGRASVMLGTLFVLADYSASGPNAADIEVVNVVVAGHDVEPYMFDAETLKAWQADIARDRAQDLRIARDAAAYEAWERKQ